MKSRGSNNSKEPAVRGEGAIGCQGMHVRIPMDQFAKRLENGDCAGNRAAFAKAGGINRVDGFPGQAREFAKESPVLAEVRSQVSRDSEHELPVRYRGTNLFRYAVAGEESLLLVTRRADAAPAAGKGDEQVVPATRTADAGKAILQARGRRKGVALTAEQRGQMAEKRRQKKALIAFLGSVTAGLLARLDNETFEHLRCQVAKAQQRLLDADIAALEAQLAQKRKLRAVPPS